MNGTSARWRGVFILLGLLAVLGLIPLAAACGDDDDEGDAKPAATIGDLRIFDPWVRTTTNDVSAGYFRVENDGQADTLVSVKSTVTQMVQLHEVVTEGSSSKMQEKEGGFPIPADGTLELAPGAFHLMMMNLKEPLKDGDTVELELTFAKAGTVKVTAPVRPSATIEEP
jgi:copper(I)-binding protein